MADVGAIILLFLIIAFFSWFFFIGGPLTKLTGGIPEEKITSIDISQTVKYEALLETVVKNPYFHNEKITIADLIVWSAMKGDYVLLEENLNEIFNEMDVYWHIGIYGYREGESFSHKISRKDLKAAYALGKVEEQRYEKSVIIPGYGGISDLLLKMKIVEGAPI